jgi:hypothetical protein
MPFKECVNAGETSATYKTYFLSSKKLICKQGLTSILLIHVYQSQITPTCKAPAYIYMHHLISCWNVRKLGHDSQCLCRFCALAAMRLYSCYYETFQKKLQPWRGSWEFSYEYSS